jgi:hypothetical protein
MAAILFFFLRLTAAILEPLNESLSEENGVASAQGDEVELLMLKMMVHAFFFVNMYNQIRI